MDVAEARFEAAMTAFGRSRLGKRPSGVSVQHWCAAALAKEGKMPPAKMNPMAWCRAHWDYIMAEGKKLGTAPKVAKKSLNDVVDGKRGSTVVMRFIQFHTGKKQITGRSMYDVASELLQKNGVPKRDGLSTRSHVLENMHCMVEDAGKSVDSKAAKKKAKKEKRLVCSTHTRTITFSVDPTTNEFLMSFEWRRVRMEALKKYGPRCMCCGATPATGAVMNVDHIKPRKYFPHLALDINNLQILCEPCNHGKGNWDRTDWRSASQK